MVLAGSLAAIFIAALAAPHFTSPSLTSSPVDTAPTSRTTATGPDILLVVLDTVRADHVGAYGYARTHTPTLDRIAVEGMLFEDATAPATWSLPSHASLFTGRFPSAHGATDASRQLGDTYPTMGEVLQRLGYETRCFTANAWITDRTGLTRGFDECDEAWRSGDAGKTRLFGLRLLDRLGFGAIDNGGALVASNFESWLNSRTTGSRGPYARNTTGRAPDAPPSFVFVNFIEAHFPYHQVPEPYLARTTDRDRGELRELSLALMEAQFGGDPPDPAVAREPAVAMYDAGVAYADHLLGRLLDSLREHGTLDDTIVIVLSDHGESLGEHGLWGHGGSLYEVETRVPLLIRYPPRVPAGQRVSTPVSTVGAFATLFDLLERPPPPTLQVPSLLDPVAREESLVLAEHFPGHGALAPASAVLAPPEGVRMRAYRSGTRKLALGADGAVHVFDLGVDPTETRELTAGRDDAVQALRTDVANWEARIDMPALGRGVEAPTAPVLDEETEERLRALGYIE
jgi:arylsulfatase A-like enzyme